MEAVQSHIEISDLLQQGFLEILSGSTVYSETLLLNTVNTHNEKEL